jgi:glutamate 5-kinase
MPTSPIANAIQRPLDAGDAARPGVVPVVNENDTVVNDDQFGDNDTLGALVANLLDADALVILTDQRPVRLTRGATRARA